jgi:hypothetical protein
MLNLLAREATASLQKVILLTNASGYLFLFNLIDLLHVFKNFLLVVECYWQHYSFKVVYWVVAPYSFVGEYQRFEGIFCLHYQSRPWRLHAVTIHKNALRLYYLNTHHRDNLKPNVLLPQRAGKYLHHLCQQIFPDEYFYRILSNLIRTRI